tara:strand:+ start:187 stop:1131 length:945 start_codon:yes stop_codon:yes gene_type:complete
VGAEQFNPDFASDENDGLASVTPFPKEQNDKAREQAVDKAKSVKRSQSTWYTSKYIVGSLIVAIGIGATVTAMGPDKFYVAVSNLSLPGFKDNSNRQNLLEQKLASLQAQTDSVKELAQTVNINNRSQTTDLKQSAEAALETGELNKASVQRLNENLSQLLQRVDALEQEVLIIATSGPSAGIEDVKEKLVTVTGSLSKIAGDVDTNTKNYGWLANRTKSLEEWKSSSESDTPRDKESTDALRFKGVGKPVVERSPWVIKLVNFNAKLGFIVNTVTGQKLRVKPGVNVPNCGNVTVMSAQTNTIKAGSCLLQRG